MDEAVLNRDLCDAAIAGGGWSYKIVDATASTARSSSKRPFDGFAVLPGAIEIKFESKLLKGYQAFALDRVAPHQYDNLREIARLGAKAWVTLGVWEAHHFLDIFTFDICLLWDLKESGIKSINKKQLLSLKERGLFVPTLKRKKDDPFILQEIIPKLISSHEELEGQGVHS